MIKPFFFFVMSEYINILSRVHNIEQILVGLTSAVNDIRNRPQQELSRIKNLETKVAALEQSSGSQHNDISGLTTRIGDLEDDINGEEEDSIVSQIENIKADITALTSKVEDLEQEGS